MRTILMPLTEKSTDIDHKLTFCLNDQGIVTYSGKDRIKKVHGVNVTDLSIIRHIPLDDTLNYDDILILAYLSYLYVLRISDTRTMRRLTKVPRQVVTDTVFSLFRSFDLVSYKIATLRCVYQSLTPKNRYAVEQQFIDCGLKASDAVLYFLLYDNNDIYRFVKSLETIEDTRFVLDNNTLSKEIDNKKVVSEFEKAATYHANNIRFIAHGNRLDFNDLRNDLRKHAIHAYYWVRPFYNKLHAINYAKNSIRGYKEVTRDYYNKEDRRRIVATEDGYDNVIRDLTPDIYTGDSIYEIQDQMADYIDEKAVYR